MPRSSENPKAEQPGGRSKPRRVLRRTFRWLLRATIALALTLALYFLAVWILGAIAVNRNAKPAAEGVDIFVWSNGIHVDILVPCRHPAMDWAAFAPLKPDEKVSTGLTHVLIGWGDRGFYLQTRTAEDFSIPTTLKAMLWPTPTAVHMSYQFTEPPTSDTCARVRLSEAQYRKLTVYIRESFSLDAEGKPRLIPGAAYHGLDVFYEGTGSYHLLYTCNNWANGALKTIGVRTAAWSPLAGAILDHQKPR